ncbi:hypothetical protein GGI07_000729 [Coemansia sp. Benny D115]|nr:hypothetical protein GGI07_000729 [Coemansia sp. Benny D115]
MAASNTDNHTAEHFGNSKRSCSYNLNSSDFDSIETSTDGGSSSGTTDNSRTLTGSIESNPVRQKRPYTDMDNNDTAPNLGEGVNSIEACVEKMVIRRDQLRRRFKEWAGNVDCTAKKLRGVTDNALVNQSTRLEQILNEGRGRIEEIVGEQNRIHSQLSSFVAVLSNAQSQIFGSTSESTSFIEGGANNAFQKPEGIRQQKNKHQAHQKSRLHPHESP